MVTTVQAVTSAPALTPVQEIALVIGYLVTGLGMLSFMALLTGLVCTYAWRKILKDVPSLFYVQNAVSEYKKKYPPEKWAEDNLPAPDTELPHTPH